MNLPQLNSWIRGNKTLENTSLRKMGFNGRSQINWSMQFVPDGSKLLSGSTDKVNVWDTKKGQRIQVQNATGGYIQTLAVSWDGKLVATTGQISDVTVYSLSK